MGEFIGQFLAQVWGFVLFLGGLIVLYIGLLVYMRQRRIKAQAEKKAAIMGEQPRSEKAKPAKKAPPQEVDEVMFGTMDEDDGEDPLAELYAVRAEAAKEELARPRPPLQKNPPKPEAKPVIQQEEEVVDLASLLAGMAEDAETEYHAISEGFVSVKREDGVMTDAKELLSVQRDERDKRLMVQLGTTAYRSLLNNANAKATFTKTMKELSGVILAEDSLPPAPETVQGEQHHIMKEPIHVQLEMGGDTKSQELFSILRDENDGHLMIQIGEIAYRSLKDNAQAKNAFTKIMKELSGVILTADTPVSAPQVETRAEPAHRLKPTSIDPLVEKVMKGEDEENLPPGVIRVKKMDELSPSYTVGSFGRMKIAKPEKVEDINIAEAIEAYLQYKIEQAPQFQKRGIHVRPTFSGGVRIEADGKNYEFVDDVEDAEVKAFIKQAIAEWQDQH